jgi:CRP/FNR family transcriptional regulator
MRTILETDHDFICDIQAPCFQLLLPEEANLVRSAKTQVLFRKEDNLTKQGAFASYVLFLISGWAKQYIEGDSNRNFNIRFFSPGEFIGLSAVFDKNTHSYSSLALTECQAILIEKEAISRLIRENGEFGFSMMKRYTGQNSDLYHTLQMVLYKQMHGRMAETLLYVDSFRTENPEIFQLLSRKDMADFAGISTESAIKLLKNFEKEGLIQLQEKDIRLINLQALNEISRKG